MTRQKLTYNPGYWWHNRIDNTFHKCVILGDWDSAENYTKITDVEKDALDSEEIEDSEALDIILDR